MAPLASRVNIPENRATIQRFARKIEIQAGSIKVLPGNEKMNGCKVAVALIATRPL
jgi:hypothetical protein